MALVRIKYEKYITMDFRIYSTYYISYNKHVTQKIHLHFADVFGISEEHIFHHDIMKQQKYNPLRE